MKAVSKSVLFDILKEALEIEEITDELRFDECEMWDSLAQLSLIAGLEEIGVDLTGDDLDNITTVNELFVFVSKRVLNDV